MVESRRAHSGTAHVLGAMGQSYGGTRSTAGELGVMLVVVGVPQLQMGCDRT